MYGAGMGPELFKWLCLNLTSLQITIGLGVTRVIEVREKSGEATNKC
jgi:hypothetical protein